MSKTGFITLHRDIKKHWIWDDPIKFQWWVEILMTVNHSDQKVLLGEQVFLCKRGQSLKSQTTWAKLFKTNRSKVRRFFVLLEKHDMVRTKSVQKSTMLTVCNYGSYQDKRPDSDPIMTRERPASDQQVTTNNNENNYNNDQQPREQEMEEFHNNTIEFAKGFSTDILKIDNEFARACGFMVNNHRAETSLAASYVILEVAKGYHAHGYTEKRYRTKATKWLQEKCYLEIYEPEKSENDPTKLSTPF